MKTRLLWTTVVGIFLTATISFAQNSENRNPYAIFGSSPYIAGDKAVGANAEKVFVIENFAPESEVARIEHEPLTGKARLLDKHGKLLKQMLLKAGENGWLTQDRFAEKYYSISPYAFCAGNPVRFIDINGDSLWINHKGINLLYVDGNLYNRDGSAYTGKVKGFLKQTRNALNEVARGGTSGSALVSDLQSSDNNYTIKYSSGKNAFVPTNTIAAMANIPEYQTATGNFAGSTGSGGTILFDPYKQSSGFNTAGTTYSPAYSSLAHEMVHASDANQGMLHYTGGDPYGYTYTNPITGFTYNPNHNGLNISEWRAVYGENQIRSHYGAPLRTHYGINNGEPYGPRLIDINGNPIIR